MTSATIHRRGFPFASVVGQDDAKLALLLVAVDPRIGGVLLRGEKGSAKTTLARGLADLLPGDASFVDLPLGATEDRLIGSLDLTAALTENRVALTPGLLAAANGGVLYVDEANLLADHLVDTLLDVAVSGVNRVERDGVSHHHDARFVLVGSMNPEEGELRPQFLDRFGLSVQVTASTNPVDRAEAVRRRLDHDTETDRATTTRTTGTRDTGTRDTETDQLRTRLASARPASVPDELIEHASRLALAVGAEGLRADIVLCRAAAAHAGLDQRSEATIDDLRRVAPLVLAHRSRRQPFDPPVLPPEELSDAIDQTLDVPDTSPPDHSDAEHHDDHHTDPDHHTGPDPADPDGQSADASGDGSGDGSPMATGDRRTPPTGSITPRRPTKSATAGRRVMAESDRGRLVRDVAAEPGVTRPIAVVASVRRVTDKRRSDPEASLHPDDLRHAVRERKAGSLLILVVDTSGSMGATERANLATGAAFGLLTNAYERRDHVAVITCGGTEAAVVLAPTASIEVAKNRLSDLRVGGATPLAEGLSAAHSLIQRQRDLGRSPVVVLISDGRASGSDDALDRAIESAAMLRRSGAAGLVLDCETGLPKLGLAGRLAEAMDSPCISATDLNPQTASAAIRAVADAGH